MDSNHIFIICVNQLNLSHGTLTLWNVVQYQTPINALPCFYSGFFSTDIICFALWADVTAGFALCSESTCINMASASSLLAQLHWKSLWSKRDGGYEQL